MHNFVARKSRGNWRISHCTLSYLMQSHSLACCSLCSKSAEGHNAEGFLVWKPALLQTWREISWMMLEQIKQHSGILHDDSHYHLWIYHLPRASWDLGTIPIKATMKVLWKNIWNKSPTKATFILTWKTYRILQCFSGFWWHNIVTFQTCYLEDHPTYWVFRITPMYKPFIEAIWKGSHNPTSFRGRVFSPWLSNHVSKSWDPPSTSHTWS